MIEENKVPSVLEGKEIVMLNPMAPIVESYRHAFLGCGAFEWKYWLVSLGVTAIVVFAGLLVFNKVEKNFIDTV